MVPTTQSFATLLKLDICRWDCSIALLARSASVFPPSYYNYVLDCDDDAAWNIFTLSGVPKQLFQYLRELIQLASEKEQVSRMKYASFDMAPLLELERCIQDYTEEETTLQGMEDGGDLIQIWHDYRNASNAWKYALLLYIARVLKWDRTGDAPMSEITSLSRLLLDSVRCCRPESNMQKQLLFPVFVAGAESMDLYSRRFVKEYCEEWYKKCRYNMFREASGVLDEVWAMKDMSRNDSKIWWGGLVGHWRSDGREYLFG
jgi:hypothetical protein